MIVNLPLNSEVDLLIICEEEVASNFVCKK